MNEKDKKIDMLSKDAVAYIIESILEKAIDSKEDMKKAKEEDKLFYQGRFLAYYEILDSMRIELEIHEEDELEYKDDLAIEKVMNFMFNKD